MWLQKRSTFRDPLRYFAAVATGFSIDFATYAALVSTGASIYTANLAGFIIGSLTNLLLIRRFVFTDSRFALAVDIPLTLLVYVGMFLAGTTLIWIMIESGSINPYMAKLLANGSTFCVNYLIRRTFFRK